MPSGIWNGRARLNLPAGCPGRISAPSETARRSWIAGSKSSAREGVPYALGRLRRRQALAAGIVLWGLWLALSSVLIWDIRITGNESVPREEILRALEENGVRRGAWGLSVNGEDIRNHLLLEIPELSWAAVNVSGCRADVQVRERRPAPELLDRKTPCNITARRGGWCWRSKRPAACRRFCGECR